jgi:hypothetical protein
LGQGQFETGALLNLIVAAVLTPVFNAIADKAADETLASDYAM